MAGRPSTVIGVTLSDGVNFTHLQIELTQIQQVLLLVAENLINTHFGIKD